MNLTKYTLCLFAFPLLFLFSTSAVTAQSDPTQQLEASYEVALHVVIGSNEGARTELPANLSTISKRLKSNFSFSNYRLANTFLGRVSNTGTVEYKSVSNILGQEIDADAPTFLEWTMVVSGRCPTDFRRGHFALERACRSGPERPRTPPEWRPR